MTLHVGQKVVCVDATPEPGRSWGTSDRPIEGAIYTVRAVVVGGEGLQLHEITRSDLTIAMHGPEAGYWAWRFVPVNERKKQTDISCFLKLLTPTKERVG